MGLMAELNKLHREQLAYMHRESMRVSALVTVRDVNRILGHGLSRPGDLILDNFGKWLAAFIRAGSIGITSVTLKDDGNNDRVLKIYDTTSSNLFNYPLSDMGTKLRVGSGTTTPTRADVTITTPFTTAPENAVFNTGVGSYAVGVISFSGAITAGGSGTVNECGFYGKWRLGAAEYNFMLFHDVLAAGVSFTAGQIINVSYSITL